MLHITVPLLAVLIGALAYGLSTNAKVAEMGRIAFAAGLVVALYVLAQVDVRLP